MPAGVRERAGVVQDILIPVVALDVVGELASEVGDLRSCNDRGFVAEKLCKRHYFKERHDLDACRHVGIFIGYGWRVGSLGWVAGTLGSS